MFGLILVLSGVAGLAVRVLGDDPWWYLQIGRNIHETTEAAGVIEKPMHSVWNKIKDFGDWNFVDGMSTVCAQRDQSSGLCVVRNVSMKGFEFGGYKFGHETYLEKQDIKRRHDGLFKKVCFVFVLFVSIFFVFF